MLPSTELQDWEHTSLSAVLGATSGQSREMLHTAQQQNSVSAYTQAPESWCRRDMAALIAVRGNNPTLEL